MHSLEYNKGLTLIEIIVYIALFMLLIGGGMISAFYIIDSSERNKSDLSITTEAQFLLRKIDWALTSVDSVSVSSDTLIVDKSDSTEIRINLLDNRARLSRDGGSSWEYLTAERIFIEDLTFNHTNATPPTFDYVEVSFTANGKEFEMLKYLRK